MHRVLFMLTTLALFNQCSQAQTKTKKEMENSSSTTTFEIQKTEAEWKKLLTEQEYYVLRQKGTERAFTGDYWNSKDKGVYHCKACNNPLFHSETKFNSGTGWPSFYQPVEKKAVKEISDHSHGMVRTEVVCGRCRGHLGHVFDDGPQPTGLRYCMNSISLKLKEE